MNKSPNILLIVCVLTMVALPFSLHSQEGGPKTLPVEYTHGLTPFKVQDDKGGDVGTGTVGTPPTSFSGEEFTKSLSVDVDGGQYEYAVKLSSTLLVKEISFQASVKGQNSGYHAIIRNDENTFDLTVGGEQKNHQGGNKGEFLPELLLPESIAASRNFGVDKVSARALDPKAAAFVDVTYNLSLFSETLPGVPKEVQLYSLTGAKFPEGHGIPVQEIVFGSDGRTYRLKVFGKYVMSAQISGGSSAPVGEEAQETHYEVLQAGVPIGYMVMSRAYISERKIIQVKSEFRAMLRGTTVVQTSVINAESSTLRLLDFTTERIRAGGSTSKPELSMKGRVKDTKLEIDIDSSNLNKPFHASITIDPSKFYLREFAYEYFGITALGEGFDYNFVDLIPVMRDNKSCEIKTQYVTLRLNKDAENKEYMGLSSEVSHLEGSLDSGKIKFDYYILKTDNARDRAGTLYEFPVFISPEDPHVQLRRQEKEIAMTVKDDQFSSKRDTDGFHFKMGLRRDIFKAINPADLPEDDGQIPSGPTRTRDEEQTALEIMKTRFQELKDLLKPGSNPDREEVMRLLTDLDALFKDQRFLFLDLNQKKNQLNTQYADLKKDFQDALGNMKEDEAAAVLEDIKSKAKNIEAKFDGNEFALAIRLYDDLEKEVLDPKNKINDYPEKQTEGRNELARVKRFRDRSSNIQDIMGQVAQIKISGLVTGEEPQKAIINGKIVGEGDWVLAIRDIKGNESRVIVFKIFPYGVEFDYKGECVLVKLSGEAVFLKDGHQ